MAEPAMRIEAKLVGGDALKRKLANLGRHADEIAVAGLMAGGEVIRAQAVANITDHGLVRSGTLRRSIVVQKEG